MRRTLPAVLCLAAAVAVASPVSAQGEFKLQFKAADTDMSGVMRMARQYVPAAAIPVSSLPGLPEGATGNWFYARVGLGQCKVILGMAEKDSAKLYVDTNGDGVLKDEKPVEAATKGGNRVFGPVTINVVVGGDKRTVSLSVMQPARGNYLLCSPGGYWAGTAELGGKKVSLGLVDSDWDGRIARGEFSMKALMSRRFDGLAIDLDGDGKFAMSMQNFEVMPLPRLIQVAGVTYSLEVKPDGSAVTFTKVEPQLGTLDAGSPDVEMMLFGDTGVHRLTASGGKWQVPAGEYIPMQITLAKKDDAGAAWTLSGRPGEKSGMLRVEAGRTLEMGLGGPLAAATDVQKPAPGQPVSIGFALKSAGGVEFAPGATKDGKRQDAPTFKILGENGTVLKADKFSYG